MWNGLWIVVERFMSEEDDWDHNVDGDAVEGPADCK